MPRPRFSNWPIRPQTPLGPSASMNVDLDLVDTFYPQVMVLATYAASGDSPITCTLYPGFAVDTEEDIIYANNGNSVTEFSSVLPATELTIGIAFAIDAETYPRYVRAVLTNPNSDTVQLTVVGDR